MPRLITIALIALLTGGCTGMVTERFAHNLGSAILNQNDPETVRAGAPAFLLLLDSLVLDEPDNPDLLRASATLNGAYASVFVRDPERAARLSDKARKQSRSALCHDYPKVCELEHGDIDAYRAALAQVDSDDIDTLFTYGASWAGWIQTHSKDWGAVADLSRVEAVMTRIVEMNETYEWGRAHLYLGVIHSQLPPALGGKPEVGRAHFEKAIEISKGHDLIAEVEYARSYARLMFDQELHDKLLKEVLAAKADYPGLTLTNTLAQQQAKELLSSSAEYFEE